MFYPPKNRCWHASAKQSRVLSFFLSDGSPDADSTDLRHPANPAQMSQELAGTAGKGMQTMMLKLTLRYTRYAIAMLATVGFGIKLN